MNNKIKLKIALSICLLLGVVAVAFLPSLNNGFVNWDDPAYVTSNTFIQGFSLANIKHIFTSFFVGNYQPLTLLSYLFEYNLFGPAPVNYHLTSLILHILNAILVFWLIRLLTQKTGVALVTALLFGVHPLHVESVAWVSARKDLLYTLFFLTALICYVYYLKASKIGKYYYLSLIFFIFSLLSKAMATVLPVILFNLDYFVARKMDKQRWIDKIPFFVLSLIFGILGVIAQYSSGVIRTGEVGNLLHNFSTAYYSTMFYLNKIFLPIGLSCSYPRPENYFPWVLAIIPLIYIAFCIALSRFKEARKIIIFGNVFFLICTLPILQFVPFGETIVADRYMYLAVTGIFYLLAEGLTEIYRERKEYKRIIKIIISIFLVSVIAFLSLLTQERCKAWKDSFTLWNNAISEYPEATIAYYNRGTAFISQKKYNQAILDFKQVIGRLSDSDGRPVYLELVKLYRALGDNQKAAKVIELVRKIDARLVLQYYEIGNQRRSAGKYKEAISLYKKGLALYPDNLALVNELGVTYLYAGRPKEAAGLFKKVLEARPDFALAHNNLALAYFYEKEYTLAVKHVNRAKELGYKVEPEFLKRLDPYRK